MRVPGSTRLSERSLGFSAQRSLPRWRRDTFLVDAARARRPGVRRRRAARRHVHQLLRARERARGAARCCAPPAIASRWRARRLTTTSGTAAVLRTHVPRQPAWSTRRGARRSACSPRSRRMSRAARPIVGLEPSCLLSLRDEYPGDAARRGRRSSWPSRSFLVEEFLAGEHAPAGCSCRFSRCRRSARCCTGIATRRRSMRCSRLSDVLRLVPELEVDVVESSCCGMAGSFGYEAAHYDGVDADGRAGAAAGGARGGSRTR